MNNSKNASLAYPPGNVYEDCMITSFLKNLFSRCRDKKDVPDLKISSNVASMSKEIDALNTANVTELSSVYLQSMEEGLPDVSLRYALIYKDNRPVFFTYFQLFSLSAQNFMADSNKSLIRGIVRCMLQLKKAKVLILGNALRTETESYSFDALSMNNEEAIAAVAGVAEKLASTEGATAIILKDIPVMNRNSQNLLGRMGYDMPWEDLVMDLTINPTWTSIYDYVGALSRKYKTRANKILAAAQKLEIRQLDSEEIARNQTEITRLFGILVDRQPFTLSKSGVSNFLNLKKLYGHRFEVTGFFLEQRLVAFYSAFADEETYELYYVGFEPELNNELQLYFNILFSGLERAIKEAKQILKLGRTSFDAKASLGARARKTDYRIKFMHIPDVLINKLAAYFSSLEDGKWRLRNPLK